MRRSKDTPSPPQDAHSAASPVPAAVRDLEAEVLEGIARHRLVAAGQRVLVAVSGGRDSMVLLDLLDRLRPRLGLAALGVAHVDHGLRPDSAADARWVEEQAAARGLPFLSRRVQVRPGSRSPEEAARIARYQALASMARQFGAHRIALAHHAGDQAETVLMRLLTGAGLRGLAGMRPRRGRFIRPLLAVEPARLAAYAAARRLPWREDPTNRDPAFLRNRIRHQLLPLLQAEFNPRVVEAVGRVAAVLAAEDALLRQRTRRLEARLGYRVGQRWACRAEELARLAAADQRRVLQAAYHRLAGRPLPWSHCEAVRSLATGGGVDLPGGWRACRRGPWLWLEPHPARSPAVPGPGEGDVLPARPLPIPGTVPLGPGLWLRARRLDGEDGRRAVAAVSGCRGPGRPAAAGGARFLARVLCPEEAVRGGLVLRRPEPGEAMQPLGARGRRSVDRLYREAVRRGDLDLVDPATGTGGRLAPWVVAGQDGILWLVGVRAGERCRVRPGEERVVCLEVTAAPAGGP